MFTIRDLVPLALLLSAGALRRRHDSKAAAASNHDLLMVGNSYIYYNGGVDGVLRTFFDDSWFVKAVTSGGKSFEWHLGQANTGGTAHHTALTSSSGSETSWDFVVFQEYSTHAAHCCQAQPWFESSSIFNTSKNSLMELDSKAAARGATTVLYQTWGRRDGLSSLGSFIEHGDATIEGYKHYASLITRNGRTPLIAPVGVGFRLVYDDVLAAGGDPSDGDSLFYQLYDPDGTHPSNLGTYLAACVFYGTITGESPVGLPSARGLSAAQAAEMQAVAVRALASTA